MSVRWQQIKLFSTMHNNYLGNFLVPLFAMVLNYYLIGNDKSL